MPAREVAEALGLSLRTLQRWKTQPEFKAQIQSVETESSAAIATQVVENVGVGIDQIALAGSRAVGLMNRAIDVMEHTLNSPDSRVSDRLRVAQILGKWNGFEVDFECALAALRRYGLILWHNHETDTWEVCDLREEKEITPQK